MPRRSSPDQVQSMDDLSRLDLLVVDKRKEQRADAKKNRRNRHYERQFLRNAVVRLDPGEPPDDADA